MLTQNLALKLFALLLAVMLELYFNSPVNLETADLTARIEVSKLPAELMIVNPPRGARDLFARISVRGPSPLVSQVKASPLRFDVQIPAEVTKSYVARLDRSQLRLPSGVTLIELEPRTIEFGFEPVLRKELTVHIDRIGEPANGFVVKAVRVTPEKVLLRGPSSFVSELKDIKTEQVDVTGLDRTKRFEIPLVSDDSSSSLNVNVVSVTVEIAPIVTEKKFSKIPVTVQAPSGFAASVQPSKVSVVVAGPKNQIEALEPSAIEIMADVRSLGTGKHEVVLVPRVPDGIDIMKTVPLAVQINLVTSDG